MSVQDSGTDLENRGYSGGKYSARDRVTFRANEMLALEKFKATRAKKRFPRA